MNKIDDDLNKILNGGAKKSVKKNTNKSDKQKKTKKHSSGKKLKPKKHSSGKKSSKKMLGREKKDALSPRNVKEVKYEISKKRKFDPVFNDDYVSATKDTKQETPYNEYDVMAINKLKKSKIDIEAERTERMNDSM